MNELPRVEIYTPLNQDQGFDQLLVRSSHRKKPRCRNEIVAVLEQVSDSRQSDFAHVFAGCECGRIQLKLLLSRSGIQNKLDTDHEDRRLCYSKQPFSS